VIRGPEPLATEHQLGFSGVSTPMSGPDRGGAGGGTCSTLLEGTTVACRSNRRSRIGRHRARRRFVSIAAGPASPNWHPGPRAPAPGCRLATHLTLDDRIDQAAASVVACATPSDERLRDASARKVDPAEQGRLARIAWARYRKPFPPAA